MPVESPVRIISGIMLAALTLALTGCGARDDGEGVGGVTASEARALNDAAEMLDSPPPSCGQGVTCPNKP